MCKKYLNADATHVLDPTMLLTKDDYIKLVNIAHVPQSEGNLFYYFLDPKHDKMDLLGICSQASGLKPFSILPKYQEENRTKEAIKKNIEDCVYPPIEAWLRAFIDSKMVICDSFHGCVFSIIFNKPFWVIGNKKRGLARFRSLLAMFDLEERLIDCDHHTNIDFNKKIDWDAVNAKLSAHRKLSLTYLNFRDD